MYTPLLSMPPSWCLLWWCSPSGWKVRAWGRVAGGVRCEGDGEGSLEKRRMRPPQKLETELERKVDELGEPVLVAPFGGVTAPGEEEAGDEEESKSGDWRERRGWLRREA